MSIGEKTYQCCENCCSRFEQRYNELKNKETQKEPDILLNGKYTVKVSGVIPADTLDLLSRQELMNKISLLGNDMEELLNEECDVDTVRFAVDGFCDILFD